MIQLFKLKLDKYSRTESETDDVTDISNTTQGESSSNNDVNDSKYLRYKPWILLLLIFVFGWIGGFFMSMIHSSLPLLPLLPQSFSPPSLPSSSHLHQLPQLSSPSYTQISQKEFQNNVQSTISRNSRFPKLDVTHGPQHSFSIHNCQTKFVNVVPFKWKLWGEAVPKWLPHCRDIEYNYPTAAVNATAIILHNNKAGGSSLKSVIIDMCNDLGWYCEGGPFHNGHEFYNAALRDGPNSSAIVPRVVFTPGKIGDCEAILAPCFYLTTVREPISHLISEYHYFCTLGKENRHKWTAEEKLAGHCNRTIEEWPWNPPILSRLGVVTSGFTQSRPSFDHSPDEIYQAVWNLLSPCMWYMLLDDFDNGFKSIGKAIGPPWETIFDNGIPHKNNHSSNNPIINEYTAYRLLQGRLKGINAIYQIARIHYAGQFSRTLTFC